MALPTAYVSLQMTNGQCLGKPVRLEEMSTLAQLLPSRGGLRLRSGSRALTRSALRCRGRIAVICSWWPFRRRRVVFAHVGFFRMRPFASLMSFMAFMVFVFFVVFFAFALVFVLEIFVPTTPLTAKGGTVRFLFGVLANIFGLLAFYAFFLAVSSGASVRLRVERVSKQEGKCTYPQFFSCHKIEQITLVKDAIQTNGLTRNFIRLAT